MVSRNGDLWFFLTNEERDVAREIGHVEVSAAEKARLLGEMVFDEVLAGLATIPAVITTSNASEIDILAAQVIENDQNFETLSRRFLKSVGMVKIVQRADTKNQ